MTDTGNSARSILLGLGLGDFTATLMIPYMFMAPSQTDPQMGQIQLVTKQMQRMMITLGADAADTGTFDSSWAPYLRALAGPGWVSVTWFVLCRLLLEAKNKGLRFEKTYSTDPQVITLGDAGIPFGLPDVPGGLFTYAFGAFLVYRHFRSKR